MRAKIQAKRRRPRPRLERGEPVVRKVLAAALSEVARAGYHGLRIDDVAARAGVNKTTVYRRWPTKQELLRDALLSITTETFVVPDTGSLRGDLLAVARRNLEFAARPEHHGVFRIFAAEGDDAELAAIVRTLRASVESVPREVLAAAERRGEVAAGVDTRLLFEVLGVTLNWWLLFERVPVDEPLVERLIDLLLHGALAPRRASATSPAKEPHEAS